MKMEKMDKTVKTILKCTEISKNFGYFQALKKISLKIEKNSIFGILGPNGAGKTTLLKIMAGLLKPSKGEVVIAGMNYEEKPNEIKSMSAIVSEISYLYEELTIQENLKFYANLNHIFHKEKISEKIDEFTKLFHIYDWLHEPVRNLSKGMKKKVEIIRSLVCEPTLLFLDEPFSGLDLKTNRILLNLLNKLNEEEKISTIIASHHLELVLDVCDELIVLKRGKIVAAVKKNQFKGFDFDAYI